MKNQQKIITREISNVVNEIDQLKRMIQNLNNRMISNSDKIGIISFLSDRKSKLIESSSHIAKLDVELLDKEEPFQITTGQ